jgi:hypothetical protein
LLGRPKNRWEDDGKRDITRMKITNWKDCIRNWIKAQRLAWFGHVHRMPDNSMVKKKVYERTPAIKR